MRYTYSFSATVSPAKNFKKLLFLAVAAILALSQATFLIARADALSSTESGASFGNNSSVGTESWNDTGDVDASDNDYAEVDLGDNEISKYLKVSNYGFSVPNDATIDGIKVEVERKAQSPDRIKDYSLKLQKGGVIGGDNKAAAGFWGNSETTVAYGSDTDKWGLAWTPADINASDFGFVFSAKKDTTQGSDVEVKVDHIKITVYYTEAEVVPELPTPDNGCLLTQFASNANQYTITCVVQVTCSVVSITADRDLSDVIVKHQDGSYDKYDSSDFGTTQAWDVPQLDGANNPIIGLWIHAGNNHYASDPDPEEFNNGNSVGRYHEITPPQCEVLGEEDPGQPCTVMAVSDTTNKVVEYGNEDAVALSFIHSAWTADVPGATWIWSDNPVANPTDETVRTFTKTFGWNGSVDTAVIKIAADNDYKLWVNGILIGTGSNTFAGANEFDIKSAIASGNNTIKVEVTNWAWPTSDPQVNPAGLKFKAVITSTLEQGCNPPVVEDVPEVPVAQATLVAQKIVCDNEADLPNDGFASIGETTATDWLAAHQGNGCGLADNWSFQYKTNGNSGDPGNNTYGELAAPWTTFTAAGTTATVQVPLEGVSLIETREVLPQGYIPFNSNGTSAEFYCHNDAANFDNWEWIQSPADGATYYCVAFNAPEAPAEPENTEFTLHATKILCDSEAQLPNWGTGEFGPIGATTATDWLSAEAAQDEKQNCHVIPWTFQWAPDTGNPGDETEEAGTPWSEPFGTSVNIDTADLGEAQALWIREVFDDNYIPFGGQNTTENVSAEIYCYNDVLHFDNWERIENPVAGEDYYCVAWNVLKPIGEIHGLIFHDVLGDGTQDPGDEPLEGWKAWLLTHNSPFTLAAEYTTGDDGLFVFHDLPLNKTYYVCQDLQDGWFQTKLAALGIGLEGAPVGTVLGDSPALDALIDDFCYEVTLTLDHPIGEDSIFGNYQPPTEQVIPNVPKVLGDSTEKDPPAGQGHVLATSTLANTGETTYWPGVTLGIALILVSLLTTKLVRTKD